MAIKKRDDGVGREKEREKEERNLCYPKKVGGGEPSERRTVPSFLSHGKSGKKENKNYGTRLLCFCRTKT